MEANSERQITDSPWFWVLIFCCMALAALLAMGPKYGSRQAGLELQYQARERVAAERAAESRTDPSTQADLAGEHQPTERRGFASPGSTLIPLWPLSVLLSILVVLAALMLARQQYRSGASKSEEPS